MWADLYEVAARHGMSPDVVDRLELWQVCSALGMATTRPPRPATPPRAGRAGRGRVPGTTAGGRVMGGQEAMPSVPGLGPVPVVSTPEVDQKAVLRARVAAADAWIGPRDAGS